MSKSQLQSKVLGLQATSSNRSSTDVGNSNISIVCKQQSTISYFSCIFK